MHRFYVFVWEQRTKIFYVCLLLENASCPWDLLSLCGIDFGKLNRCKIDIHDRVNKIDPMERSGTEEGS
jgi:hypothetical protein